LGEEKNKMCCHSEVQPVRRSGRNLPYETKAVPTFTLFTHAPGVNLPHPFARKPSGTLGKKDQQHIKLANTKQLSSAQGG